LPRSERGRGKPGRRPPNAERRSFQPSDAARLPGARSRQNSIASSKPAKPFSHSKVSLRSCALALSVACQRKATAGCAGRRTTDTARNDPGASRIGKPHLRGPGRKRAVCELPRHRRQRIAAGSRSHQRPLAVGRRQRRCHRAHHHGRRAEAEGLRRTDAADGRSSVVPRAALGTCCLCVGAGPSEGRLSYFEESSSVASLHTRVRNRGWRRFDPHVFISCTSFEQNRNTDSTSTEASRSCLAYQIERRAHYMRARSEGRTCNDRSRTRPGGAYFEQSAPRR